MCRKQHKKGTFWKGGGASLTIFISSLAGCLKIRRVREGIPAGTKRTKNRKTPSALSLTEFSRVSERKPTVAL